MAAALWKLPHLQRFKAEGLFSVSNHPEHLQALTFLSVSGMPLLPLPLFHFGPLYTVLKPSSLRIESSWPQASLSLAYASAELILP